MEKFGSDSPFISFLGPDLIEWRDGYIQVGFDLRPELMNRAGILHGGVTSAILDHVGGMCGLYSDDPDNPVYGVTLNLNVNFLSPGGTGRVIATGTRVKSGRSVFFSEMTLMDDDTLIATATGVFKLNKSHR